MTTNVFDGNSGLIATDSRWSILFGNWLAYVDDVRFEKIERYKNVSFMFAGNGLRIQEWKNWLRSEPANDALIPSHEGISVCVVESPSGAVLFSERQDIIKDGAYFAGTGSRYAFMCWDRNRCAQKSVETAKTVDVFTGGDVKYFDAKTGGNNLNLVTNDITIEMVGKAIETRGMVMNIAPGFKVGDPPFRLADVAASNEEMAALKGKIASGELSPEAPCDGMHSEWTEEQKQRLRATLGKVFGWKS